MIKTQRLFLIETRCGVDSLKIVCWWKSAADSWSAEWGRDQRSIRHTAPVNGTSLTYTRHEANRIAVFRLERILYIVLPCQMATKPTIFLLPVWHKNRLTGQCWNVFEQMMPNRWCRWFVMVVGDSSWNAFIKGRSRTSSTITVHVEQGTPIRDTWSVSSTSLVSGLNSQDDVSYSCD